MKLSFVFSLHMRIIYDETYIIPCQQEIKREWNEHLISPDMVTKESQTHSATDAQQLDS